MPNHSNKDTLVRTLNTLLASLKIPFILECPLELTPSLTLTIFESMLKTRLPISKETRKSATYPARVEAMKIFIGVLEDDVLGIDLGLGDIDPRRLAEGRHDEVLRVAEILCWLGKRMNYVSPDGLSVSNIAPSRAHPGTDAGGSRPVSPSMVSAMSTSHDSSLLMHSTHGFDDSQTTTSAHEAFDDSSHDLLDGSSLSFIGHPLSPPIEEHSLMLHEHDHLHEIDHISTEHPRPLRKASRRYDNDSDESGTDDSYCHCPSDISERSSAEVPILTSGRLETIDFENELRLYELRRGKYAVSRRRSYHDEGRVEPYPSDLQSGPPTGVITRHTSPTKYTLALLNERARLLAELSRLQRNRS